MRNMKVTESIKFIVGGLDSHKCFDGNTYTFPVDGYYVYVTKEGKTVRKWHKNGETVELPKVVVSE